MSQLEVTAGLDLGDRYSHLCLIDTHSGAVIEESRLATNPEAFERHFSASAPIRVAIEASTHSPWVSRLLESCGHEVLVANARKVRLIYSEARKSDKLDAENLARLARLDPKLLSALKHRGEASQAHLTLVRSRDALVSSRTKLVNHVRGAVKSFGGRLPKCSAQSFHKKAAVDIPEPLKPALKPLLETIESLTTRIRQFDRELEALAEELYPETKLLRQVNGIGPLSALAFVADTRETRAFRDEPHGGGLRGTRACKASIR